MIINTYIKNAATVALNHGEIEKSRKEYQKLYLS